MKRIVKVSSVSTGGVKLKVWFEGHPPVGCLNLYTAYSSYQQGYPDSKDKDLFITVWSPAFDDVGKASTWLFELTCEVKELARISEAQIATFKAMESVEDI